MAWELRKGSNYYYTGRCIHGRFRKIYHGSGEAAQEAAARVAAAKAARQSDQNAASALQGLMKPLDRQTDDLDQRVELLLTKSLLSQGFHHHRGQWRKRREQTSST